MTKLSICIPTYNRQEHLIKLVTGILSSSIFDIEIVVLDDKSTDSTLKLLKNIKDCRLNIFQNPVNRGSLFSMVNILHKGKGDYLLFLTDKDYLFSEKLPKFIEFLRKNKNVSAGYCSSSETDATDIYPQGMQAIAHLAYMGNHPTGYFFKADVFNSLNFMTRYSSFDDVELFPFEFMLSDIGYLYDLAIYRDILVANEKKEDAEKIKSYSINGNDPEAYFHPSSRFRMSKKYLKHAMKLKLTKSEKNNIYSGIFMRGLYQASFGYKKIMSDKYICAHHYIETRNVSNLELFTSIVVFYINFVAILEINKPLDFIYSFAYLHIKIFDKVIKIFLAKKNYLADSSSKCNS